MSEPIIQTTNLTETFQALRGRDPLKIQNTVVPNNQGYKPIPRSNYAPSAFINMGGMTRTASASGGGGTIYGQPQFFSPVHTNVNWQIPSKRLEIYQWLFLPNTQVLSEDFTYNSLESLPLTCKNIIDDTVTNGFIFEIENYPKIMNSEGSFNQPPKISIRNCENKKCFSFKAIGNHRTIRVSEEHNLFILNGKSFRKNKKLNKNKKYRLSKNIKSNGVVKVEIQNNLIERVQAKDISKNDYLLTPVPNVGNKFLEKDLAWIIGFCVADGCLYKKDGYAVRFTGQKNEVALLKCKEILEKYFPEGVISSKQHGDGKGWRVGVTTKKAYEFFKKYIDNKGIDKKFSKEVFDLDKETRLNILAGYFDGDGSFCKTHKILVANCYSIDLSDQLYWLSISCEVGCSLGQYPLYGDHYATSSDTVYRITIPSSQVLLISSKMKGDKVPLDFIPKKERELKLFYIEDGIHYFASPIDKIEEFLYTGKGFDIEMTNDRHALVADGYIASNCRFFYNNEPKVASAIDFYSLFPMSNWEHECRNRKVRDHFDKLKVRLKLPYWCRLMSHEIHLLGDCFPMVEITCPECFIADTMILTQDGHVAIENIKVGDMVLTKNRTYKEVTRTMSFKHDGGMVEIEPYSLPKIKSTDDHKHFIVRPIYRDDNRIKIVDWNNILEIEAKDIVEGDYLVCPINNFLPNSKEVINFDGSIYRKKNKELGKKLDILLDEDFARLLGWYVAEGSTDSNRSVYYSLCIDELDYAKQIQLWMKKYFDLDLTIEEHFAHNTLNIYGYSREISAWLDENCGHGANQKKIPNFIMNAPQNIKKAFLEAYILGDGHKRKDRRQITMSTVSRKLCYDLFAMHFDLGISCYVDEKEECTDNLGIHRQKSYTINYREIVQKPNGQGNHREDKYIYFRIRNIKKTIEQTTVYNITVDEEHNYCANMFFTKNCNGTGRIGTDICEHDGGTVKRLIILNPDYVEVLTNPLNPEPVIALRPDEELINMVSKKIPGYEKLSPEVIKLIASGQPIRLDNRNVFHLKYGECGYEKYGIGMVRRLFPILSYKTKLMVAQWIVAERLIVPIKLIKVGSDERPAGPADIAAVQANIAATANDPNLAIVTHHAFDIDYIGASGKILTLNNEFEFINQEILDGMMINNALLNGEGPGFCHSDDTRILTNNGLKYRTELDIEEDLIATFNKDTGALEYQKASKKWEYSHNSIDGNSPKMKRFLTKRMDILVTPNHKMLYAPRKISFMKEGYGEWTVADASEIKKRAKFRACVDKWEATIEEKESYFGIKREDFLKIIGWYASEGYRNHSILKDGTESISKVSFSQSQTANPETYEKMKEVLVRNNLFKVNGNENVFYLTKIANEELVNYLANNMGKYANNKHIPQEIKKMSRASLKILLEALVDGDGHESQVAIDKKYYEYYTVSTQLRDDVIEILFKLGFSPRFHTTKHENPNHQTLYTISWSDTENGKFPTLDSKKWNGENKPQTQNQVISDEDYVGKVWCVEVPNHFIITERNGLFAIHGNSAAAVGIEAMIQRLTTFRESISSWLIEAIYLPEAKRQGFIDENADTGEDEYIIPKIKWNSMHLRDQQQYRQFVIQLYEKGLLSAQTVLEAFDFDPDQEIERKRYDSLQMTALGQGQPGQGGAGGGGLGGAGGGGLGGGMGGGEPPISPGGEGGGGDLGAGPALGGNAPAGGGVGGPTISKASSITAEVANPGEFGGKILKQKSRAKFLSERLKQQNQQQKQVKDISFEKGANGQMRDEKGRIIFTGAERQLWGPLRQAHKDGLFGNLTLVPQFRVQANDEEYVLDFAFPQLKVAIEADGEIFHSAPKQVAKDEERDAALAQQGWTTVRFWDTEIEKKIPQIIQEVVATVKQKQANLQNQVNQANQTKEEQNNIG